MAPEPGSLPAAELERLAQAFRLLGDPGRLRLVAALLDDRELSVRALSSAAVLSETATSQQLRVLHHAGVVRRRRVGRQVIYRLSGSDARAFARSAVKRAALRAPKRKDPIVTYIITEPCIDVKDKSCVDVCPVDCIHESDRMLVIDPRSASTAAPASLNVRSRRSTLRTQCRTSGAVHPHQLRLPGRHRQRQRACPGADRAQPTAANRWPPRLSRPHPARCAWRRA